MEDSAKEESNNPAEQAIGSLEVKSMMMETDPANDVPKSESSTGLLKMPDYGNISSNEASASDSHPCSAGDAPMAEAVFKEEKSDSQTEVPMDTNDPDMPPDRAAAKQAVQGLGILRARTPDDFVSIMQQKDLDKSLTGISDAQLVKSATEISSRPSSAPAVTNVMPKPKPVSIFAKLFPASAPEAESDGISRIQALTSPTGNTDNVETMGVKPTNSMNTQDISAVHKMVKSEAIVDVESSFPAPKVSAPVAKTGTSGEVGKSISPTTIQMVDRDDSGKNSPVVVERMDIEQKVEKLPPTTRAKSASPKSVPELNITVPIAGKTIKKEQRKSSNSSPTIPGEQKKAPRTKSASPKSKKKPLPPKDDSQDGRNDFYCWVCHKEGEVLCCELCPRVFHAKCLNMSEEPEGDWFCPECEKITDAECKDTQSRAMSLLTIEQFSLLLKYVIQRMKIPMSEPFHDPVDTKMFPDYRDYVFHPMDLSTIEKNVKKRKYGCPEAFISEFKWVVHNCVIYNSPHSKLTQTARAMVKVAERELNEIEVCPECYLNSCRKRENWFCEPCKELHPLVWAKLQGFPHWPAKALRIEKGLVDVRFFGQHDRAWIPLSGCYLISKELPLPIKNKKKSKGPGLKGGLDGAMQEMQGYIENIKKITGDFEYAPPRTLLTHCDLYRKTASAKTNQTGKQLYEGEAKVVGSSVKVDTADSKAKMELKDIGASKEMVKARPIGQTTPKKGKTVTTSGEHPTRSFATKKKKASIEFLSKTIESCKASLGIEKIPDVKMSGSEDTSSSSDEDDVDLDSGKEKMGGTEVTSKDVAGTSGLSSSKPADEEDDSDAELVIDLGDMDESTDAAKEAEKRRDAGVTKATDGFVKKRKSEDTTDKPPSMKPQIKSILLNAPKPVEKEDRKKMLAKALSEKIGGKRKLDSESGSPIGNPSVKIRRTIEQQEKRGGSPSDIGQKKLAPKEKELKRLYKDNSGKVRSGILKSSTDPVQRKDAPSNDKKISDQSFKHRHKDGSQKPATKKSLSTDKPGRIDKIPTEADARKLFNGGRIPRKNPSAADGRDMEEHDLETPIQPTMETRPLSELRRNVNNVVPNPSQTSIRQSTLTRQTSSDPQRKSVDENITMASLKKYSDKVMDTVQKVFYEMYTDMMVPLTSSSGRETSTAASATAMHEVAQMRLELERLKWMHEQEIAELKHNHDLTVAEIRQSLEYEKKQLLLEAKVQAEASKNRAVEETKRKQWCAYCNKEAIFYCCWNTSYCDYPCQQKHWPQHMNSCSQARDNASSAQAAEMISSPPAQSVSRSLSSSISSTIRSADASSQLAKSASLISPGRTTVTISTSAGNLSKLSPSEKSSITGPVSVSYVKLPTKPSLVTSTNSSKQQVSAPTPVTTQHQQKSGLAISAIGARLLAAKQRSSVKDQSDTPTSKPMKDVGSALPSSVSEGSQSYVDHVITTMESPLSPDAKPPSPKKDASPLLIAEDDHHNNLKDKSDLKPPADTMSSLSKLPEDEPKSVSSVEVLAPVTKTINSSTSNEVLTAKTGFKVALATSKAVFSSPSAVASLIADMGTPLSSTLSSSESSFSDTPEKKPDPPKVCLNQGPSSFSKIGSEELKPTAFGTFTGNEMEATARPSEEATSEPEAKETNAGSSPKGPSAMPLVAPVLADSYLASLQKSLPARTKTPPPREVVEEDSPAAKPGLPRPILPESDEDRSCAPDTKISDSDPGEPMETDGKT